MAQAKSATKISEAEVQQLSDQIESLKEDMAAMSQSIIDMGKARQDILTSSASEKIAHLRNRGEQYAHEAQTKVADVAHQTADAVRNQPAAAVGIAAGVGFLMGFLSGRK